MLPSSSFLTLYLPSLPCPMFLGSVCGSCCSALHYALDLGSRLYHGSCAIWVVAAVDFPHLPCSAAELGVLGCSWLPGTLQLNRATLSSLGWPYLCAVLHAAPQSSPFLLTSPVSSTAVWDLPILYHGIPFTHWSSICCNVHVGFSSCPLPCGWPTVCALGPLQPFLVGELLFEECLGSVLFWSASHVQHIAYISHGFQSWRSDSRGGMSEVGGDAFSYELWGGCYRVGYDRIVQVQGQCRAGLGQLSDDQRRGFLETDMEWAQKENTSYNMEKSSFWFLTRAGLFRVGHVSVRTWTIGHRPHHSGFGIHHLPWRSEQWHFHFPQCCWCAVTWRETFTLLGLQPLGGDCRALYSEGIRAGNGQWLSEPVWHRPEPVTWRWSVLVPFLACWAASCSVGDTEPRLLSTSQILWTVGARQVSWQVPKNSRIHRVGKGQYKHIIYCLGQTRGTRTLRTNG